MKISCIDETARGKQELDLESLLFTERRIFIEGMIDDNASMNFAKQMMYLSRTDEPVSVYINSPGGAIGAGLAIYDMITGFKGRIDMYCIGCASSMAAVLLASGQKGRRFILPHSRVMIHEALVKGDISASATSIRHLSESIIETRDLVNGLLARHTGKTLEEINAATVFDNLMSAEEAVDFGICDRIVSDLFERSNG